MVAAGLTNDAETRRGYREVLFAHPQIGEWLAGAILFEETLGQANAEGIPFPQVCCVDTGTNRIICSARIWHSPNIATKRTQRQKIAAICRETCSLPPRVFKGRWNFGIIMAHECDPVV